MTKVSCKPKVDEGGRNGNGEKETATVGQLKLFFPAEIVPVTGTETGVLVTGSGVGTDQRDSPYPAKLTNSKNRTKGQGQCIA